MPGTAQSITVRGENPGSHVGCPLILNPFIALNVNVRMPSGLSTTSTRLPPTFTEDRAVYTYGKSGAQRCAFVMGALTVSVAFCPAGTFCAAEACVQTTLPLRSM